VTFFNFDRSCPSIMCVNSQGGIALCEYHCMLPKDHVGPHRSQDGVLWVNTQKPINNVQRFVP
jgi:hypothetical protein